MSLRKNHNYAKGNLHIAGKSLGVIRDYILSEEKSLIHFQKIEEELLSFLKSPGIDRYDRDFQERKLLAEEGLATLYSARTDVEKLLSNLRSQEDKWEAIQIRLSK